MCVCNNITGACREIVLKRVDLPRECRVGTYALLVRVYIAS